MTDIIPIEDGKKKKKGGGRKRKSIDTEIPGNPNPPPRVGAKSPQRFHEFFPVVLTPSEMEQKAAEMTKVLDEIDELEAQKKQATAHIKAQIDGKKAELRELRSVRRAGKEDREIELCEEYVFSTNTVKVVRTDTGEVVRERAMRADERQGELPLEPPADAEVVDMGSIGDEPEPDLGDAIAEALVDEPPTSEGPEVTDPQAVLDAEVFGAEEEEGE